MNTTISESETPSPPDASSVNRLWQRAFDLCVRKTRSNIRRLADHPLSAALAADGNYFDYPEGFYEIGNWTSSFFTGMALIAWRETRDKYFLEQVLSLAPFYREKVFTRHLETHHDLGFLYSLYSVALYKLTGDPEHRKVGLRAAELLSQRFNENGNFIRAWGPLNTTEQDNLAIIDCLMNLPLLYWASAETGDARYRDIAARHADTTLKCFVRADDSVYHAYRFDLKTGKPLGGDTYGGWAAESHWARGTAWAIYGFALSYGYIRDPKYLDASLRLARKFISELDLELVPLWDFRLPPSASEIAVAQGGVQASGPISRAKGQNFIRDTSAAAIAVCGFQELLKHKPDNRPIASALAREIPMAENRAEAWAPISRAKQSMLSRLCRGDCLSEDQTCPGVLKDGQVSDGKGGAQNAYTSWGDYFLMEALDRELRRNLTWW